MDPLSDVLSLLKLRAYAAGGFDLGGDWSIRFDAHVGIKCYALISGGGWLMMDSIADPIRLRADDCVLLPSGQSFRLARRVDLQPVSFKTVLAAERRDGIPVFNGGGDTVILGGHFAFAGHHADILLGTMPAVVPLYQDTDKTALRWALTRMREELRDAQPGVDLVAQHLAHLMLVQALRQYLAAGSGAPGNWLFALADPRMAAALSAIHEQPGARWTVRTLAVRAGMSRSNFAETFKAKVGCTPMVYLTRWRMLLAGERLWHGNEPVSTLSLSLGYESESAFSTAFKRAMGCSPRRYAALSGDANPQ